MTDGGNPWVSRPAYTPPQPTASTPATGPGLAPTGPVTPQRGITAPDRVAQLHTIDQPRSADLWWMGAHGGSGESSLASLVQEWPGAHHAWPRHPGNAPARVVVTARSNARGLRAAQTAVTQWAAGLVPYVELIGLAIIADAPGRLPRPLRDLAQVVSGGYPRVWTVPWIESWRLGQAPDLPTTPREVKRLVDELSALIQGGPVRTANREEHR